MNAHAKRRPPFLHVVPSPLTLAVARTTIARPVGKVAELLLRQSWNLRLKLAGFRDIEGADGALLEYSSHRNGGALPAWSREEYYRRLAQAAWYLRRTLDHGSHRTLYRTIYEQRAIRNPEMALAAATEKDRRIGLAMADGESIRSIRKKFQVGQKRIERVRGQLHELMAMDLDSDSPPPPRRFERPVNEKDQKIGAALVAGHSIRAIKRMFQAGEGRIYRVRNEMTGKETDDG